MRYSVRLTTGFALLAVLAFCASSALAQDPVKIAPDMYKVRLDNARVRVLEVSGKAGQKSALHKHPDYVVYSITDGTTKFTDAKGAPTQGDLKAGTVMWRPAETHASEAVTDIHAMLFELKGPARAAAARADDDDPVKVDPNHYKVLLDNERVRVLEFRGGTGETTPMHSHPDYITYNLSDGKTKFSYPKGKPVEVETKAGDVKWHKAETHAGQNTGGGELHILIVELK